MCSTAVMLPQALVNNVTKLQYNIEPVGGSNETPSLSGEGAVKSQRNESMSQG